MHACHGGHKDVVSNLIEHGEQLHFFSCCVIVVYKKDESKMFILCEGEESHGC